MSCAICQKSREDHGPGKTMHAYTEDPGDLVTPKQKAKRDATPAPMAMQAVTPTAMQLVRLTQVLMHKGIIDQEELLYITFGDNVPEEAAG